MTQASIRDDFVATLDHIDRVRTKLDTVTGLQKTFSFPDQHKLAEGLFLSAWTHWEQFLRLLFKEDLTWLPTSSLQREVRNFRTKKAPDRLAESMIGHPDARRWVEWSEFGDVVARASVLLGTSNRFCVASTSLPGAPAPLDQNDLAILKRIRNAIAHKSDYAWDSFRKLAKGTPFSLTSSQMKGITVGRFLSAHKWNGNPVLEQGITLLKTNAQVLVP